jgi:signal transduction histidine kinase/ActR/RegA family two-component response regulator
MKRKVKGQQSLRVVKPQLERSEGGGQNALFHDETQQRLRHTETLLAVSEAVGSTVDLPEMMRRVARETARALGADMAGAYLAEGDQAGLRPVAGYHVPKRLLQAFREFSIPLKAHRFLEEAWAHRKPVFSDDAEGDPRINRETFARFPHRSVLFVPMLVNGAPIGGLFAIWWKQQRRFSAEELGLVEGIGHQAALTIENARLFASQQEVLQERFSLLFEWAVENARRFTSQQDEAEVSGALLKLAEAVESLQPLGAILDTVVRITPQMLGLKRCALFRFDPTEGILIPTKAWGLPDELRPAFLALRGAPKIPGVVKAIQSQEPVVVEAGMLEAWIPRKVATPLAIRSMLVIPLFSGGRLMGTMTVDSPGEERTFTPKQIAIARGIAAHAAIAIDNAQLYGDAQRTLADLKAAQAQLVRGETLRALGELASGIAHHLNNLLAVILMRVELLLGDVGESEVRNALQIVERTTLDAAEVVRRVHEFSRVQPVSQLTPLELNLITREVVELTRPLWQAQAQVRGIEIQVSLEPGDIPVVMGDPAGLREVLMNLLLNAVDALPKGGRIVIRTWGSNGRVHCSVADTGVGMSEEVRRRVWEPFFTTKGPKSTGLGLSIAYQAIERHGGELSIESAEGEGTTITLSLPVASAQPASATPRAPASLRILVIDDEERVRAALKEMLAGQGRTVFEAPSGPEALAWLEGGEPVDLVLTDLVMPGMTGWEVARAIKVRWPGLPVGMITGWGNGLAAPEEERASVSFILAKPFTRAELREAIARACPGRQD